MAVDSLANVAELGEARGGPRRRTLRVVIEVDIGMSRAGVAPGEAGAWRWRTPSRGGRACASPA